MHCYYSYYYLYHPSRSCVTFYRVVYSQGLAAALPEELCKEKQNKSIELQENVFTLIKIFHKNLTNFYHIYFLCIHCYYVVLFALKRPNYSVNCYLSMRASEHRLKYA